MQERRKQMKCLNDFVLNIIIKNYSCYVLLLFFYLRGLLLLLLWFCCICQFLCDFCLQFKIKRNSVEKNLNKIEREEKIHSLKPIHLYRFCGYEENRCIQIFSIFIVVVAKVQDCFCFRFPILTHILLFPWLY